MTATAPERRPRLIIADDEPLTRSVLWTLLQHDFDCVGVAADATGAVELARALAPDVAVLDVRMPGGGAPYAVPAIRDCSPGTAIAILSSDEERTEVVSLLTAGAMTYMRKGIGRHELAQRLHAAIVAHRTPLPAAA